MKRYHDEITIIKRNWKAHRRMHVESNKDSVGFRGSRVGRSAFEVDCECDEQKGRFRKKDAYDCGNARCPSCHSDKFPKRELTIQEKKGKVSYREQLKEI